ncbi:hypothetical protein U4P24_00220, partial [Klebsiella pneumoniae]
KVPHLLRKANVTEPKNTRSRSLLDQVLISEKNVNTKDGYAKETDVRTALISAKIEHSQYLRQYEI